MKKTNFLMLLLAAAATTAAIVACDKATEKISEFSKGQADAQAFCKCVNDAGDNDFKKAACYLDALNNPKLNLLDMDHLSNPSTWSEYEAGWLPTGAGCMTGYGEEKE
jgi:hypothetical protein